MACCMFLMLLIRQSMDSGKEIVAYVPSTIISNLPALTLPTYIAQGNHKYFVDGSPNAGDAYFDADGDGA